MSLQPLQTSRFIRRTSLGPNEYRKNFRQLDKEVIDTVTSHEADRVTPLMSKIYLRLANAPIKFWEREGVLRFEGEPGEGKAVTAWVQLCEVTGVASATASKALRWMHEQGVIGYFAGKNGVGLRIFLNRASSSIGVRAGRTGENFLSFPPASSGGRAASCREAAFSDSYAVSEVFETKLNPRAPKNGAETRPVGETSSDRPRSPTIAVSTLHTPDEGGQSTARPITDTISVKKIVECLRDELEPRLTEAAARAAAQSAAREMERTRGWFETKALPKAARVAQHETYDLLRKHGALGGSGGRGNAGLRVGRGGDDDVASAARALTPEEFREVAEVCIALLEAQGKPIEVTLSEISSESGGWLMPEDTARVRELIDSMTGSGGRV